MKRVLTILTIALAVVFSLSLDSPSALAGTTTGVVAPTVGGAQAPQGGGDIGGVCGGDGVEGDPDDLGGGFRSTSGHGKPAGGDDKPPLPPLIEVLLRVQTIWLSILR
jgi:hypothetical protein